MMDRILITGGAGFVGSNLAKLFKQHGSKNVVVLDNLKRRGTEYNLTFFRELGIEFVHGDIRDYNDLNDLPGNFDLLIEASAEPSVHAGMNSSPNYLLQTNLQGTIHCLEFARKRVERTIFLSTSRVYSLAPLKALPLLEKEKRFVLAETELATIPGISTKGIAENFSTNTARTLYGTSKLASEMLIQEYCLAYNLQAVINRCGVIAGPGQFGKVDQGVFSLWVAKHFFKQKLCYMGFSGKGKQVRDLLHPNDLYSLICKQLQQSDCFNGEAYNVGGGNEVNTSLLEFTELCQSITGNQVDIDSRPETAMVDIPFYISDTSKAQNTFEWQPEIQTTKIVNEIFSWLKTNEKITKEIFCS